MNNTPPDPKQDPLLTEMLPPLPNLPSTPIETVLSLMDPLTLALVHFARTEQTANAKDAAEKLVALRTHVNNVLSAAMQAPPGAALH